MIAPRRSSGSVILALVVRRVSLRTWDTPDAKRALAAPCVPGAAMIAQGPLGFRHSRRFSSWSSVEPRIWRKLDARIESIAVRADSLFTSGA
jgi:hypothetical protein